ncbi:hypothetical protein MRX96_005150 [Rhipicephalus microplus]
MRLHVLVLLLLASAGGGWSRERCEDITIPMCKGIGYNQTSMPNQFNQDTQDEAGMEVHQFWPLVEIQCSDDLKFFLCSLYTPICMEEYAGSVPACRSVCERARAGCAPIMRQYGFAWPERMNCDALPQYGDAEQLCMDAKEGARPDSADTSLVVAPAAPLINTSDPHFYARGLSSRPPECALPCRMVYFNGYDQTFATYWVSTWAVLCCVSTSLTVLTFLIDTARFRYPERPIIFLSFCYLMVSVGYLVRLAMGHEPIACDGNVVRYYVSSRPFACTLVFILLYFFGMASSMWWVILTLTWLLAAGLKWGNEAIASYSQYFHMVAWAVPTVKTIVAVLLSAVDGDSVAGVCYVGNQDLTNLRAFVLGPLCLYLLLGTSFLLAGFVSLFRIRSVIRAQARAKADKLEKLMIRIGIFSVLYTVPATVVIACYFYEHHYREPWLRRLRCPCPRNNEAPQAALLYVHGQVLHVSSRRHYVWLLDLVREDVGIVVEFLRQALRRSPPTRPQRRRWRSCHGGKQLPLSHV